MEREKIEKMFEGRWRVFGNGDDETKRLCHDFFEAGMNLSEDNLVNESEILDYTFEEWWNLYDKKRGRDKCLKKWQKLSDKEKSACIAATPAYVQSTEDKTYRKDPLTYLNGKCWNDEIIFRNGKQPTIEEERLNKLSDILTM